jgi:rubrerythrin
MKGERAMMSAGGDAPAELVITSMRLREQQEARNESPLERLLHAVDTHAAAEADALGQYEYLAEASGDPVIALVMRLILDDEVRHHGLLHRMSATLRDALEWTSSPEALPKGAPKGRATGPIASLAHLLIEEERTGARALRRLADEEKDINGGLDSLLLEMMAMDSEKHAHLLQFVQHRLEASMRQ